LEWASYNGNLYGTPRWPMDSALARGRTFLVEIEVKGTRQLRERGTPGMYLFIEPPSIAELRRRLELRGTNAAAEIDQRVRIAEEEMEASRELVAGAAMYDHRIVNLELDATIATVEKLIWP
jgi:guanylate kinase